MKRMLALDSVRHISHCLCRGRRIRTNGNASTDPDTSAHRRAKQIRFRQQCCEADATENGQER